MSERSTRPDFSTIGDSGLLRAGGYVIEEFLPELRGERGRRVLREMITDPIIGGILFAIEMLIRRLDWRLDPADDSNEAHRIADRVEAARDDMELTWTDTITEALSFVPWGFAVQEINWKRCQGHGADPMTNSHYDDGVIAWRRWGIRAQDTLLRWEFDPDGNATAMIQLVPYVGRTSTIPLAKCLHFRTTSRQANPEGVPLLRHAYVPWYLKKRLQQIEAIGVERSWAGLPMAKVPAEYLSLTATGEQRMLVATMKKIVTNIRADEQAGVVWPSDRDDRGNPLFELGFLVPGGAATIDTDRVIQRYNRDIARAVQADFMFLGEGKGSYALSVSRTGLFARALQAWVTHLTEEITRQAITPLLRYNGWPEELTPTLAAGDIGETDLSDLGTDLLALSQAGLLDTTDPDLRQWVAERWRLPVAKVTPSQEQEAGSTPAAPAGPAVPPPVAGGGRSQQAAEALDPVAGTLAIFERVAGRYAGLLGATVLEAA